MSIFMLETESATSAATSIDGLTKTVTQLASDVSSYDTSSEDSEITSAFDAAKSTIASNLDACAIKIANTSGYINTAVSSHTSLQESMKFMSSEEKAAADAAKAAEKSTGGSSTGGSYSGGGYTGGGGGGYYSTPATPTPVSPSTSPEETPTDIKEKINEILHKIAATASLSDVGKKLFESEDLDYNAAGYATIGGMFVIACSKAYGKVGDEIEFTLKDGQKFKCIIGQIDDSLDGKLQFFVNDKWKEDGKENFQKEIGDYVSKIQNLGANTTYTVGATVSSAIDWATKTANDNTHGYSQQTRWGNPNYDCSSFVISSFEAAGIKVKEAGASYTGDMKNAFLKCGFEWIPGTPDVSTLQPGDVLLNEGTHTEMYYGDGKMIGAHGNSDGRDGDSSGNEICITKYSNKNWDGVLRYVGNGSDNKSSEKVTPPKAPQVKITSTTTADSTSTGDDKEKNEDKDTKDSNGESESSDDES